MKTDINKILKKGSKTKVKSIDYSLPENQDKLRELKKQSEKAAKVRISTAPPKIYNQNK